MSKMAAIWNSSKNISSQTVSQIEPKTWWEASGRFRIAESFSSNIQDGGHGGTLETLQTTSDSELLKTMWSDSQDGYHDTI